MTDILFFPALAADKRLFSSLADKLTAENCLYPGLPGFNHEENMAAYSKRVLKQLGSYDISNTVLIGMSFGGQLALEVAKQVQPKAIVLISCYRYSSRLTSLFRTQFNVGKYLPYPFFRKGIGFATSYFKWKEKLAPKEFKILSDMAADVNPYQLVYGAQTASTWHHSSSDDPDCPVYHIQGTKDWVIPYHSEDVSHPIANGRHLIQYTHSGECATIINELLSKIT